MLTNQTVLALRHVEIVQLLLHVDNSRQHNIILLSERTNRYYLLAVGCTPLNIAFSLNHVKIVHSLLMRDDLAVNTSDRKGCTPLYYAAQEGHIEIVQLLLQHPNIDVNQHDRQHAITPLFIASIQGHVEIVRLLLFATKHCFEYELSLWMLDFGIVEEQKHGCSSSSERSRSGVVE